MESRWLQDDGGKTLHELAAEFGVSAERIRQIEQKAMHDFKNATFNTSFVESHPELTHYANKIPPEMIAVAISAAIAAHEGIYQLIRIRIQIK